MAAEATILELIDLIYSAAGNPTAWPAAVHRLVEVFGGNAGTIHHHQIPSQASNVSADWNLDPNAVPEYTSYYGFRNIWRTYRPEVLRRGSINTSQSMCPDEVFRRSEYYNDFLRRYNLFHCLVGTLRDDQTASSNLTIFRSKTAHNFGEEECRLLAALMPHLLRAFELHNHIQGLERKATVLEDALDRQPTAIVLLDGRGKVLFVNKAAASLFQTEKALRLTATGIVAACRAENRILARLIAGAIQTGAGNGQDSGGTTQISRTSFARALQVLVSPLRSGTLHLGDGIPAAAVLIADPERKPWLPVEWLKEIYGLTRAESRLVQLLLAGYDLRESSNQLRVRVSTVRSQLKSIFAKTETKRQSELIRLLLVGPAQLLPESGLLRIPRTS